MGNQQERSLAWLAGILDGEGSISVQVYNLPDKRVRLTPFISLPNTDMAILLEVERIFAEIGVESRRCKKPITGNIGGKLTVEIIRVDGMRPVRKALEIVGPYLISGKRRNAEVILKYLDSRLKGGIKRDAKGQIRRSEYTRAEIELIASIRTHPSAKSSEAICQAPNVLG